MKQFVKIVLCFFGESIVCDKFNLTAPVSRILVNENEDEYAWLEAIEAPDDLHMRSGRYTGPAVQV